MVDKFGCSMERLLANPMTGVCDLQVALGSFFAVHGRDLGGIMQAIRDSGMNWKTGAKVVIGNWF